MNCGNRSCLGPTCSEPADHHGPHRNGEAIWTDESDRAAATVIATTTRRLIVELAC